MSMMFRPQLLALEARDVPAAFSFQLPDGTTGHGTFATPAGVDAAQASQALAVSDLTVVQNGLEYVVQPGATAHYAYGALLGVTATATGPGAPVVLANATVQVGGYVAPVAYDAADTQQSFTLLNGTTGTVSYQIPWELVDFDLASQTLSLANFNLNLAGSNFAFGTANYTVPPTVLFEFGEFKGVNVAINTTGPGFAYTSVVLTGINAVVTAVGGLQFFVAAPPDRTALVIDFSGAGNNPLGYEIRVRADTQAGNQADISFKVAANTSGGVLRDLIYTVLKDKGFDVERSGDARLIVQSKKKDDHLVRVRFDGDALQQLGAIKARGVNVGTVTPKLNIRGAE